MILFALFATLCGFAILTASFAGVGFLIVRTAGLTIQRLEQWLLLPWIGAAGVIAVLQLWHLWWPVNGLAFVTIAYLGFCGLLLAWLNALRVFLNRASEGAPFASKVLWLITALLVLWLADRSIAACTFGDSGLYHLSATKWIESFRIVPGLANLHGRLGFNNSSFLIHAMVDSVVGFGRSAHVVNGTYLVMLLLIVAWGFARLLASDLHNRTTAIFAATLLAVIVRFAASTDISSLSTDLPATVFAIVGGWRWFALLMGESENRALDRLAVVLLLAAAVTIKLSIIAFAGVAIPLALMDWKHTRSRPMVSRSSVIAVVIAALLLLTWVGRGYILSGYPLYPSSVGGLTVDWRTPLEQVQAERQNIAVFAKTTQNNRDANVDGVGWIVPWFVQIILLRGPIEVVLPAALFSIGLAVAAARRRAEANRIIGFVLPIVVALAVWFWSAPSTRMALHLWWLLAAFGVAVGFADISRRCVIIGLVAIGLVPAVYAFVLVQFRWRHDPWSTYFGRSGFSVLGSAGGADHGFEPLPTSEFVERTADGGLTVYQIVRGRGFDVPLVSTPDFDPRLEQRDKNNLQSGFRKAVR